MSKSSRQTRHRSTDKAAVTQAPEIARAVLAVRTPAGTPLRGIDFGLERTEAGYHLGQWLESVLTDVIPPNSPDGLLLLIADTDHPHGLISGLVELDEIIEEIESRLPAAIASSAWQTYVDARANDGRRMRLEGCFFGRLQVLNCVMGALRAAQSPLRCTTFSDDHVRKLCYDRLAKLDHLSLAQAIEKEFDAVVPEDPQQEKLSSRAGGRSFQDILSERTALAALDLHSVVQELALAQDEFRGAIADQLTPAVNQYIASHPQESMEQKRAMAGAINHVLKEFGLALRCPRTGLPALLVPDNRSSDNAASRFCFDARQPETGKKRRTFTATRLESVELMPDFPRREGLARWRDRVRSAADDAGEKSR